ncbi:enoyl-CoA hydratase/isomerase family protein [Fundicoccus culcitae]|uniref:Enoyl-CoA hydratase-related protein n=1 Tax=Fundicoccus culcitae TaxID=2969821 RepID=A0ABY5P2Y4_9LACT|nr:enoyl-CoA hydratase-related protein [Fundicoccus culcitae]UUX32775.1 enoyl-CoA hydratase-related protein [Fundicoccus culcitae]
MEAFKTILLTIDETMAQLTINQPESLNVLSQAMMAELSEAIEILENTSGVRILIIKGAGQKAFVAGANIKEMRDFTPEEAYEFSVDGNDVFARLAGLPIVSIAAVNGYAFGGGFELAQAADLRIASSNAVVGHPETGLGIIPAYGGTQRLSRLVGIAKAKELIFTGRQIKAEEGLAMGLFNKVVAAEALDDAVMEMAQAVIKNAPNSVASAKIAIDQGFDMKLAQGLELEARLFGKQYESANQKIGMGGFLEKREANFLS